MLEETDRLLQCPFCRTRLFIQPKDYIRYLLPFPGTIDEEIIFVPYWRFRGMHFSCRTTGIKNAVVDKNFLALNNKTLPSTLGIRPQSLKLRFAHKINGTRFLATELPFETSSVETKNKLSYDIVTTSETRLISINNGEDIAEIPETRTELREDKLYHESFIAENVSVIYTPLFVRDNTIYDAIQSRPVSRDLESIGTARNTLIDYQSVNFLPTICPDCGWDLLAEKDSCVLLCNHCNKAFEAVDNVFRPIQYAITPSDDPGQKVLHLPFWKIKVTVSGIDLHSHEDLVKLSNPPKILKKREMDWGLFFWVPAFKIAPPLFLRAARQMTLADPQKELHKDFHNISPHSVNVTLNEACDAFKVILTDIAINKKFIMPRLEEISIVPHESLLVFHPFIDSNYELTEHEIQCGFMKNALKWGKNL